MSRRLTAVGEDRPRRADARRNRERLLRAADEVFAAKGPSASTEEVARRAGVGIGTVFRHFPSKEALLEAVFVDRLRRLAADAEELAAGPDPTAAFLAFFRRAVEAAVTKSALAGALAEAGVDTTAELAAANRTLHRALGTLLAGAQEAGGVRPDVDIAEVIALLVGASRAVERLASAPARAHAVGVILDGLRPRVRGPR